MFNSEPSSKNGAIDPNMSNITLFQLYVASKSAL